MAVLSSKDQTLFYMESFIAFIGALTTSYEVAKVNLDLRLVAANMAYGVGGISATACIGLRKSVVHITTIYSYESCHKSILTVLLRYLTKSVSSKKPSAKELFLSLPLSTSTWEYLA